MPIRIAICDDVAEERNLLSRAITEYDQTFEITAFSSGEALMDELLASNFAADLLFLDIYMPGIDGIQTAQKIQSLKKDLKLIFVSSSKEHYPQAYEVFAFNYIVKPINQEKLYNVMDRAVAELKKVHSKTISFQHKSKLYRVACDQILYLESHNKLILFHLTDGNTLQCYDKLDEMEKKLPVQNFIRCHKSFLVNAAHIKELGENHFRVAPMNIPISKKNLKSAKEQYYAYLFSRFGKD